MRAIALAGLLALAACGGSEADERGIGAQCAVNDDCNVELEQVCLTQFKGGYCGEQGCTSDLDCVEDSACVRHTDGASYCFRICLDKPECNANRDAANEANCSGSADFIDGAMGRKACIPPSG